MAAKALLLLSLLAGVLLSLCAADTITVTVRSATAVASTDASFVCATLDWWPPEKCNYDECPWGRSSILNLDLNNTILSNAVKAFGSLRIRLGGSLQDQVVYKVGSSAAECHHFRAQKDGLFGFTAGCLSMGRWDHVNTFMNHTGAVVTFGLNALAGRSKLNSGADDNLYGGNWDPSNAKDFMEYTASKGYRIDSYEFGNELCGTGVAARVAPEQYGEDVLVLRGLVDDVYADSEASSKPKVLAPGGFFDRSWFARFLQTTGPDVVDAVTHHIYNLGPGDDPDLIHKVQDPYYLSQVAQTYRDAQETVRSFAPWASAWIGEAGGAYNSGGRYVSHTFANSFWYLDQLGMASTFDHKAFCRQALIGGNYALLNTSTFVPNPDYYGALLWHRLMGTGVLTATHSGSPYLRAYSHCSKQQTGITVLLINLSNSTAFDVSVANDMNLYGSSDRQGQTGVRKEYHLTPRGGDIQSDVLLLNGSPLKLTSSHDIPPMDASVVDASSPIHVAPHSIVFAQLEDFRAPACTS